MKQINKKNHNDYIFDFDNKEFIGNFEEMYKNDKKGDFDSWEQEKMTLNKKIELTIVNNTNYSTIIDLGCGKGHFTSLMKTPNNKIFATDISNTAINIAHSSYEDIQFQVLDINNLKLLNEFLSTLNLDYISSLTVARGTLYYLSNWKEVIKVMSKKTKFALFGLNIPPNTLAFIKSENDFIREIKKSYNIIEYLKYEGKYSFIILAESQYE